jgi:hypothetical protein
VVGGEHAGEGMGGTMVLKGGPGLREGEWRERERGGSADRRARAARPLGPGRRGGKTRARRDLGQKRPSRWGRVFPFSFSIFYFTFPFCIFVSFYFLFF